MAGNRAVTGRSDRWLDQLRRENEVFHRRVDRTKLPVARAPGRFALVTCMDPRVNPAALGVEPFGADGSTASDVRIIRTIGGMAEDRSLIVGIHLAGIREIAVVMHTDCGNCLAKAKIDTLLENLRGSVADASYRAIESSLGAPLPDSMIEYLKAFDDPREAVVQEIEALRNKSFMPKDVVLHGLVYELATGRLEVVVDGYAAIPGPA